MTIIDDITNFIFVEDEPRKCDVIFLPGGSDPAVPERAAELFNAGFTPLVLPSGGVSIKTGKFSGVKVKKEVYDKDYQTDCEFYSDVLLKNGVPLSAIVPEDKSGYTIQNAFFSRRVTDERGIHIKRAMICCKSFHARRCLMLYQFAFPEAKIFVVPSEVYGINRDNWYRQQEGIDRVMGELARCGNQFVGEFKTYLNIEAPSENLHME